MDLIDHNTTASNGYPVVELRNVHKTLGALRVLRGVNLRLQRGQTTVIIGESGVGKSVTLKHIIGLMAPDDGDVWFCSESAFGGRRVRVPDLSYMQLVELRKRFGFLFQMGALFDSMTAGENVGFPLREHTKLSRAEIERRVRAKLSLVGLDGVQNKRPAELSGGQKKRVALARAISLDPEVILYDEPTTGLDPVRADVINEMIRRLQAELGVTSVVVTHDMASAYKVGDRILMLHEGQFIVDGTPAEIRQSEDARVQRFITGRASEDDLCPLIES
ncbi:MAG: ABC transporter ATP-binding protein [Phycisphaerae bacterium]|nr:ABC transporter ATP-binding protein [Phycisphaerae bacterium]